MIEILSIAILILSVVAVGILLALLRRNRSPELSALPLRFETLEKSHEGTERMMREDISQGRAEASAQAQQGRTEMDAKLSAFSTAFQAQIAEISGLQKNQLDSFSQQLATLTQTNAQKLEQLREAVEARLTALQADNAKQLEQMRATVDEKLQSTLEKRLGESFKQVSERLEQVHKGLGEMQTLATGVGDLKKVLTNVKTRGGWGEIQLGAVKNEFGKFGDLLDGVKKKLEQASSTMEDAARKSRIIERRLRDVQELPAGESQTLLAEGNGPVTSEDA